MTTEERLEKVEQELKETKAGMTASKGRNRWMLAVILIVFASLCQQASARIGETPGECRKRYGLPVSVVQRILSKTPYSTYKKNNVTIFVWYFNGVADKINFVKCDKTPFSENEMKTLRIIPLESNEVWKRHTATDGNPYYWETVRINPYSGRRYKGNFRAWRGSENLYVFIIGTRAGLNRQNNSLDGF